MRELKAIRFSTMNKHYSHPSFPEPVDKNVSLWRYMDRKKFVWLIREKRLYMPHVSRLGDELEGRFLEGERQIFLDKIKADKTKEEKESIQSNLEKYEAFVNAFKQGYFVSCWHMNEEQSSTKWEDFLSNPESGDRKEGMVIRTTYLRLRALTPGWIGVGIVKYKDDHEPFSRSNVYEAIMTKSKKKAVWENEVRAVAEEREIPQGKDLFECCISSSKVYAPIIDLSELILEIHVHPEASEEHKIFICELLKEEKLQHLFME